MLEVLTASQAMPTIPRWPEPLPTEPAPASPLESEVVGASVEELAGTPHGSVSVAFTAPLQPDTEFETSDIGRLRIRGETFYIELEGEAVHLTHPKWSLAGVGATLADAQFDLMEEAAVLASVLADSDPIALDQNAAALRGYVMAFLGSGGG